MWTARRFLLAIPGVLLFSVAVASCKGRSDQDVGGENHPFVVVLSPSHRSDPANIEKFRSSVEKKSGLRFDVRVAETEGAAVASVSSSAADAWLLPLFDYLFCQQEYGVEARIRLIRMGGADAFKGVIVVRADGPVEKLDQLEGKTIGFVDRYSTSGFVYPAKVLREANVTPKPVFVGSHEGVLEQLRLGKVDAAATYAKAVEGDTSVRVLVTTDAVPNEPIFFRKGLDPAKRDRVVDAMIAFASEPGASDVLHGIGDVERFEKVDDAAYKVARESVSGADRQVQDLVPRGWLIHNQNRAPLSAYAP